MFHLANRFRAVLDPFDFWSWMAIIISLVGLTIANLIMIKQYENICPSQTIPNLSKSHVILRILFGITQPDEAKFDAPTSTGAGE